MPDIYAKHNFPDAEGFRQMGAEEKILAVAEGFVPPPGIPENEALKLVWDRIGNIPAKKAVSLSRFLPYAAAIILLIGAYISFELLSSKTIIARNAQQTEIVFPDGSKASLNAGSKIKYTKRGFKNNRYLKLTGEAFFDVQKGGRFIIDTPAGEVEVLGTELNVYSRGNDFRVSCISGKVKVSANGSQQIILPGETAKLGSAGLEKYTEKNISHTLMWRNGEFYFEDQPLVSIFGEMERQFDVSIQWKGLENRYFTGSFSNKSLEEALEIVCIPMELKYEIQKRNKVIIIANPN